MEAVEIDGIGKDHHRDGDRRAGHHRRRRHVVKLREAMRQRDRHRGSRRDLGQCAQQPVDLAAYVFQRCRCSGKRLGRPGGERPFEGGGLMVGDAGAAQLLVGGRRRRQRRCPLVGGHRLLAPAGELQEMAELQVDVGFARRAPQRVAVDLLGLGVAGGVLQHVAEQDEIAPARRIEGDDLAVERGRVVEPAPCPGRLRRLHQLRDPHRRERPAHEGERIEPAAGGGIGLRGVFGVHPSPERTGRADPARGAGPVA
ncbi:hypothetical protein A6302_03639 [Methylobrevis pamukkalensis]|uniref:Uncharacterized protein n=1 Tax=Methylobrevis pamukkalensis TaxID=1439726 RepID=A0A1E3GYC0_9HYPH|nr:hypothetical protein A6302_03639 [Methylobrevis pamukkalensis]